MTGGLPACDPVPGGVYLCQVGENVSCGACCGLYNVADLDREKLKAMLARRTALFAGTPRDVDGILNFKAAVEAKECQVRPFPDFHHCPYIGLIGANRSRVGCLLHPLADGNGGIDYRGLSFYGGMACRIYFCPTYREVPAAYRKIVRALAGDWYLHGLIVTEWQMINAFFQALEKRLGEPLDADRMTGSDRCLAAIREGLALKTVWPFRSPAARGPANYFFEDRQYTRPPIDYDKIGGDPSAYDPLMVELESSFTSAQDLCRAERMLDELLRRAMAACKS